MNFQDCDTDNVRFSEQSTISLAWTLVESHTYIKRRRHTGVQSNSRPQSKYQTFQTSSATPAAPQLHAAAAAVA